MRPLLSESLLELALVEVGQLGLDRLLGAVALLGPEHLTNIGQLYRTVRTHIRRQKTTFPLADLCQAVQQLVEAHADGGPLEPVELLVELLGLVRQLPRVPQHLLYVALDSRLLDPDDRGGAVGGLAVALDRERTSRGLI